MQFESLQWFADCLAEQMQSPRKERPSELDSNQTSPKRFLIRGRLLRTVCSGLMKPDTLLGENARQIEVSDDQTTPYLFR